MIPFNIPYVTGNELTFIEDVVIGRHFSGDGPYTKRATALLSKITTSPSPLLTTSCTHALELAASLLNLKPGDEVILPSFTFASTANAFLLRGASPVFVDIRSDTWNMDERLVEQAITPRTRAIVVVHYGGVACDMNEIMAIAARHGIDVVEDAAHAFGATYHGRQLGTIAPLATLSFHETKNIQCGEGGALLVNDPALQLRAEILREKGTNRAQFLRNEIKKYTWVDVGSSLLPSELLAAFLTAQLEQFDDVQAKRMAIWNSYRQGLIDWAAANGVVFQVSPPECQQPAHLFAMVFASTVLRQRFIDHMGRGGVKTVFHYVPLHSSPMGRTFVPDLSLPVTDSVSSGLVRLPLYPDLAAASVDQIVETAAAFTA